MPSELWSRERVKRHFGWIDGFLDGPVENTAACYFKAGQYTDDTAMALALADALVEAQGEVVPELIAHNVIPLGWTVLTLSTRTFSAPVPNWRERAESGHADRRVGKQRHHQRLRRCAFRLWAVCCLPRRWRTSADRCGWPAARRTNPTSPSPVRWRSPGPWRGRWEGADWASIRLALPGWRSMPSAGRRRRSALRWRRASNWRFRWWMTTGTEQASERVYQLIGAG